MKKFAWATRGWASAAILLPRIDGKPVREEDAILRELSRKRPGDILELTIYRSGRSLNIKVKLGEAPEDQD